MNGSRASSRLVSWLLPRRQVGHIRKGDANLVHVSPPAREGVSMEGAPTVSEARRLTGSLNDRLDEIAAQVPTDALRARL